VSQRNVIGDRTDSTPGPVAGQPRRPGLAVRALIVLAAGIALAVPIARADGQTIDGLNSKLDAARTDAEALGAEIEDNILALAAARQRAGVAAGREAELTDLLARGQERAAKLAERVDAAREELAAARARLERALDALADRLVSIYKAGGTDEIEVLLDAEGFDDLSTRADLLGRIQAADRALAERVRDLRAALADQVDQVESAKARVDAYNARIDAARAEMAGVRAAAEAEAADLAAARAAQVNTLDQLQSQMTTWSDRVQRLEEISAAEAASEVGGWTGTGDWAIPEAIVMCESGGNYSALNPSSGAGGAYQILPSTWQAYGGQGLPHQASPAEQDAIAAQIWADSGPGAWVCAG
jgi:septal ring factor EnvC (AmiA/AmiB activator)